MAIVTRSYRIRAYPNGAQRRLLDRWLGAARRLWDTAFEIRTQAYREWALTLAGNAVSRRLTQRKRTAGHEWLSQVPSNHARLRYLRQQQRCLSRRQKGSRRREQQRERVARAHAQVRQQRQYALRGLTTRLVREFDLICVEELNVKALARGPRAHAIHDAVFNEVRRQLAYKSDWYGKIPVEVDRWFPSSKRCSECRHTLDELRLDVRQWRCPRCGNSRDRDVNAARNLLAEGLRQLAGRDDRDLRVDAADACPEEILEVLAEQARSGQWNRACMEQARFG